MELTISDGETTFVVQIQASNHGWNPATVLEVIDGERYETLFPIGISTEEQPSPWQAFEPMIRVVATELMAIKA
jgi:hypothetical protein